MSEVPIHIWEHNNKHYQLYKREKDWLIIIDNDPKKFIILNNDGIWIQEFAKLAIENQKSKSL